MKEASIFNFSKLEDFLQFQFLKELTSDTGKKIGNLNKISREIGYKSPSLLTMVTKGDRTASKKLIAELSKHWKLSKPETEYFYLLAKLQSYSKKNKDTFEIRHRLLDLSGKEKAHLISLQKFSSIREWYYLPIQTLIGTKEFIEDADWISKKLRKKVTPSQVKKAIQTLIQLQIASRDPETQTLKLNLGFIETPQEIPSDAIKSHHKGMMQRALEAIEEQKVEERHFNSLTISINADKLSEAKQAITNFIRDFQSKFEDQNSNHVYQLNAQFFEHTCSLKKEFSNEN